MTTCRRDPATGTYLTTDADGADIPCRVDDYGDPTKHCTARHACAQHIGPDELTCARCIGRTRNTLARIGTLAALMEPIALTAGVNSEAANLAGPAADVQAWTWRKVAALQGRAWHISLVEDDDDRHPYTVAARWQMMLAEDWGHDLPDQITLTGALAYLDRNLTRLANDPEQDFPDFAREIRKCARHLEAVAGLARHRQRGVTCPRCIELGADRPRALVRHFPHWCDDPACCRIHVEDTSADEWRCPVNPAHRWTHEDYVRWIEERQAPRRAEA